MSGIGAAATLSSLISEIVASVVRSRLDTDVAFCNATLVTLSGSIIPSAIISTYSPVAALKPEFCSFEVATLSATTPASNPALEAICLIGALIALRMISYPTASSPSSLRSTALPALTSAAPPPMIMPSSTAALVAESASSTLSFFSFISVSVAAPTLMTATPPLSLARRSWSFSLS